MGNLIELEKATLKGNGNYSKGYSYSEDDMITTILLLKPIDAPKHVYYIPEFKKTKTTYIARALYALLHEKGKNRSAVFIYDEKTGRHEFYFADSLIDIFRKLTKIDELKFLKQLN